MREIARGGMGAVLEGRDPELNREVAIKLLLAGARANQRQFKRFQREALALAKLSHPYIVSIHEVGEHEGSPFLVMDLVEGTSLQGRLLQHGPLPPEEAAEIVRKLALAVEHAHAAGILHRDLKPANVLLDSRGEPRLTDFGLAKTLDAGQSKLSQTGMFMGSPAYWSPEHASGKPGAIGPHSDVHGLGAILYALLTHRTPIESGSLVEAVVAAQERTPIAPSTHRPGLDPRLEAICMRCLALAPEQRFSSARSLAEALEAYLSPSEPKASGRARWLVASSLVLALASLAALSQIPSPEVKDPKESEPTAAPPPLDWKQSLAQAKNALAETDWRTALTLLDRALLLAPDQAELHLERGRALRELSRHSEAITSYTRCLALRPRTQRAFLGRGLARFGLKEYAQAVKDFSSALDLSPSAQGYLHRGRSYHRLEEHSRALRDYERALRADPKCGQAYGGLAWLSMLNRKNAKAEGLFTQAIEAKGADKATSHEGRGLARYRQASSPGASPEAAARLLRGAIADYSVHLKASPKSSSSFFNRGAAHALLQDNAAAIRDFTQAFALNPAYHNALAQRGLALLRSGQPRLALKDFELAISINPRVAYYHYFKGRSLRSLAKDSEAALAFEGYLRLTPASTEAPQLRSFIERVLGRRSRW